jgi:hypothetical protein
MTSRFILLTTAAVLLAACDRNASAPDPQRNAELERQRQAEQVANDKIRQLEQRLNDAEKQKATEREAELARVKEELEQVKRDKELAAQRARELENQPAAAAPTEPVGEAPRGEAVRADLRHIVEEDDDDRDPVHLGRVVPETQRVTAVENFYEPLDSYGDWIETDDYGYVFRPTVAVRSGNWRPYTDGRWVHTDYGWTWESNEDFGWATYHYGRWARISGSGWVWVPGKEWGPGWVSWRRGDDYCGWAPLPPETRTRASFTATVDRDFGIGPAAYIFVSLTNFGARSYAPVIERPERNVTIINKTVNITNITYNTTNNQTVVYNGGPRYDIVRAKSQQPVEQVKVNFAPKNTVVNNTKIVNIVQGNNLQIAAPPAPPVNRQAAPRRVTQKLAKPTIDKGWEGVDPGQAQQVKQEMTASSVERKNRPARPAAPVATPEALRPGQARPAPPRPNDSKVEPPKPEVTNPAPPKLDVPKPGTPQPEQPKLGTPKPQPPKPPAVDETPRKPFVEPPQPKPAPPTPAEPKPDEPKIPARKPPVEAPPPKPPTPNVEPDATATPAARPAITPRPPRLDRGPRPNPGVTDDPSTIPARKPSPPAEPAKQPPPQRPPAIPNNAAPATPRPVRLPENRPQPPAEATPPKPLRQPPVNVNRPPAPDATPSNPEPPQRPQPQRPQPPAMQRPPNTPPAATPAPGENPEKKKKKKDGEEAR